MALHADPRAAHPPSARTVLGLAGGAVADHPDAPALAAAALAAARAQERKQNILGGLFVFVGVGLLVASKATNDLGWLNLLAGIIVALLGALIMLPTLTGNALRTLATALTPWAGAIAGAIPGRRAADIAAAAAQARIQAQDSAQASTQDAAPAAAPASPSPAAAAAAAAPAAAPPPVRVDPAPGQAVVVGADAAPEAAGEPAATAAAAPAGSVSPDAFADLSGWQPGAGKPPGVPPVPAVPAEPEAPAPPVLERRGAAPGAPQPLMHLDRRLDP
jgi:hypothetical protein